MLKKFALATSALLIAGGVAIAQQDPGTGGGAADQRQNDDEPKRGACQTQPAHPMCDEAKGMNLTDTKFEGTVVVGTVLPETVVLTPTSTNTVSVAYINGQRVLVDSSSRAIIEIVP
jgi:hypothetical protein